MNKITSENLINTLIEKFPNFIYYWNTYQDTWGTDLGLHVKLLPFSEYVIDVIKLGNESQIQEIFNFVELLLTNGDDDVQTALTTTFLESLMNKDEEIIKFKTFAKYLGPMSKEYCKAWDEFTGIRTEGLWDEAV